MTPFSSFHLLKTTITVYIFSADILLISFADLVLFSYYLWVFLIKNNKQGCFGKCLKISSFFSGG